MKRFLFAILILLTISINDYAQNIDTTDTIKQDNEPIFLMPEEPAQYPGGDEALLKFIRKNIKYPKQAIKDKISGTVYVQFIVEKDGSISDVKVVRGIGGGCDEEAVRVITKMPNWIPAKQKGMPVRSFYVIPMEFVLP
ncbi:MAG: periplasmic protein TonB [Rikenellaceae bacterium]|nr:periplasmic protein TonB [Rikenellaceae bacterium]MDN5355183.1 periplasmic protein TonB [Rikenellaceae bacterium]